MARPSKIVGYSVLLGLGTCLLLIVTGARVGITPDSVDYLTASEHLLTGQGFTGCDGSPFVLWPPLLPLVIALVSGITRLSALDSARLTNALIFGAILVCSWQWFHWTIRSRSVVMLALVFLLFSQTLWRLTGHIWSEPLFIVLSLVALLSLERLLKTGQFGWVIVALAAGCAAFLTRYSGVVLIGVGAFTLLFWRKGTLFNRFRAVLIFGFLAVVPTLLWLLRNYRVSGHIAGERGHAIRSFGENLSQAVDVIWIWVLPFIIVFAFVALVFLFGRIGSRNSSAGRLTRIPEYDETIIDVLKAHQVLLLYIVLYGMFLVVYASMSGIDVINHRLLGPIYVPLIWVLFACVDYLWQLSEVSIARSKIVQGMIIMPLVVSMGIVFWDGFRLLRADKYYGRLHIRPQSATIQYLQDVALDGRVYSQYPDALCFYTPQASAMSPRKFYYSSETETQDMADFDRVLQENTDVYLVWFRDYRRAYLFTLAELASSYDLDEIARFDDGVLYLISHNAVTNGDSG